MRVRKGINKFPTYMWATYNSVDFYESLTIIGSMERAIQNILGHNMKYYRQKIGLSQEALADKALLHRSYVGAVERGKRNICLVNLVRLAEALEIEPCQLLMSDKSKCQYIIE